MVPLWRLPVPARSTGPTMSPGPRTGLTENISMNLRNLRSRARDRAGTDPLGDIFNLFHQRRPPFERFAPSGSRPRSLFRGTHGEAHGELKDGLHIADRHRRPGLPPGSIITEYLVLNPSHWNISALRLAMCRAPISEVVTRKHSLARLRFRPRSRASRPADPRRWSGSSQREVQQRDSAAFGIHAAEFDRRRAQDVNIPRRHTIWSHTPESSRPCERDGIQHRVCPV